MYSDSDNNEVTDYITNNILVYCYLEYNCKLHKYIICFNIKESINESTIYDETFKILQINNFEKFVEILKSKITAPIYIENECSLSFITSSMSDINDIKKTLNDIIC